MQKKNSPRTRSRSAAAAATRELSWSYLVLIVTCGCILAAGFFFAARQHFLTMDYGFKNSRLKKQLEELESEKRRLMLAREVSLSPFELQKVSRTVAASSASRTGRIDNASASAAKEQTTPRPEAIKVGTVPSEKKTTKQHESKTLASVASVDGADRSSERKPGVELTAMVKLR